ncbi:hypothetical protein roselon_00069 [Roseibacterium elongatum DSM 19469]|uniref:Uncharacterized protein n=1 Tax=Roseicyclus elongatus DSM 19469 TaxID=1294273 RepID=W8RN41_9RHOB|nr:hypothetical protein roselon_00069 [Roseibacterium elongatum DSM 19469]
MGSRTTQQPPSDGMAAWRRNMWGLGGGCQCGIRGAAPAGRCFDAFARLKGCG